MAVLRAPSIVRPLGRPLCGSFAPLPPSSHPQGWFSGLSPTDEEEHFFKARCLLRNRFLVPIVSPLLGSSTFSLFSALFLLWRDFFSGMPWTDVSFKIAPRGQTDAAPSLSMLASRVEAVGRAGRGPGATNRK